jgi:alpha-galactosidase
VRGVTLRIAGRLAEDVMGFRVAWLAAGFLLALPLQGRADDAPALDAWKNGALPFSFIYGGKNSADFLASWNKTDEAVPSPGGTTHRYTFHDPATSLQVVADVRTYDHFPAIDWVLHFSNTGQRDTPIIENVLALAWAVPVAAHPVLHWAQGSNASGDDFMPHDSAFNPNGSADLNSAGGRSSNNNLPFFNLQDGDHGLIGAIGWTGNWVAQFHLTADGKSLAMNAGMRATHFLLHPGETVRSPRIVLLGWTGGDVTQAQNVWRQFVLSFYSPGDGKGHVVTAPLAFGQGNDSAIGPELTTIQALHDKQVPIDAYWVDATWYGNDPGNWVGERGNWFPAKQRFPDGLRPLGDALSADGFGFILWTEAEAAMNGTKFLTEHPDWYLRNGDPNAQALLNLGNPDARKGMADFIIGLDKDAGVTWYRQDFNVEPEGFWAKNDTPDRVGITEMKDIDGLYLYWDAIRAAGLQIDNCASGGRRLDIETISRSVSLFRTDHGCNFYDPLDNQRLTQGLNVWLPLNSGTYAGVAPNTPNSGASLVYAMRSSYSAGWLIGTDRLDLDMMKPGGDEFDEVRPFFLGDFFPLTPYSADPAAWTVHQWHRPDLKAGIVLCFRRQGSTTASMTPGLHAIDPGAQYSVETRTGLGPGETSTMSGKDLANMTFTVTDKPGSLLVLYKEL